MEIADLGEAFRLFVAGIPAGLLLAALIWVIGYVVAWAIRIMNG